MRKSVIIILLLTVAVLAASLAAFAHSDMPDVITIDKAKNKKPPVVFPHEAHAKDIDCMVCHHKAKAKEDIQSCFECHGKDPAANDPTVTSAKENPFHIRCRGCHKEQGKGPTNCGDCHKK